MVPTAAGDRRQPLWLGDDGDSEDDEDDAGQKTEPDPVAPRLLPQEQEGQCPA